MACLFAAECTRLHTSVVDILIRFVVFPQPADNLVAGVERGLLAFETGVFGGDFFEDEVLGRVAGDFVGPRGSWPGRRLAFGDGL